MLFELIFIYKWRGFFLDSANGGGCGELDVLFGEILVLFGDLVDGDWLNDSICVIFFSFYSKFCNFCEHLQWSECFLWDYL